jgi:uncharacterized phage-like protein YoqJ
VILGVTGHRPDKLGGYSVAAHTARVQVAKDALLELKPTNVLTGMALGWDQAVAEACVALHLPFTAVVPFRGQESVWPMFTQKRYHDLMRAAVDVHVVSTGSYAPWKLMVRNGWIVDRSDAMLACYDGSGKGGTAQCLSLAFRKGIPVHNRHVQLTAQNPLHRSPQS